MDPLRTLGLGADATPEEVLEAYRRLAKRWHPDRAGAGDEAAVRMAQINAAYDALRSTELATASPAGPTVSVRVTAPVAPRPPAGHWLPETVRTALGRELLVALQDAETVAVITPAATWKSPRALLALTDRRLLWLLDDAISHRVHALRFGDIARVEHQGPRRLRRSAVLRVRTTLGRKLEWAELPPAVAADLAARVARGAGLAVAGGSKLRTTPE